MKIRPRNNFLLSAGNYPKHNGTVTKIALLEFSKITCNYTTIYRDQTRKPIKYAIRHSSLKNH